MKQAVGYVQPIMAAGRGWETGRPRVTPTFQDDFGDREGTALVGMRTALSDWTKGQSVKRVAREEKEPTLVPGVRGMGELAASRGLRPIPGGCWVSGRAASVAQPVRPGRPGSVVGPSAARTTASTDEGRPDSPAILPAADCSGGSICVVRAERLRLACAGVLLGLLALLAGLAFLSGRPAYALSEVAYVAPGGDCGEVVPCYGTIQQAADAAEKGATIKVARGVYTSTGSQVLVISKAITVTGGYTVTDWEVSDPARYPTVLDAQYGVGRRGLVINGSGVSTITVQGLTIRRGHAPYSKGGGVYVFDGTAVLSDDRLEDNSADYGGGIYLAQGSLWLYGNLLQGNQANWDGGGLAIGSGTALLEHNQFLGNTAARHGGGLSVYAGEVQLSGNTFLNNSADSGGGLAIAGGRVSGVNDVIARSISPWEGVYVAGGALSARHWTMASNSGYALTTYGGSAALTNTIVYSHSLVGLWGLDIVADHTLFFANGGQCDGGAVCTNDVVGDPRFFWPVSGNYHIRPDSAALNAGVDAGVTVDMDGESRPSGDYYDLGADELGDYSTAYLPLVARPEAGGQPPPGSVPIRMYGDPPINFALERAALQAKGQDLAFAKIGFHVGVGGNRTGFGDYLNALAADGVPAMVKSVDDYGVLSDTLFANPDNVAVFRMTGGDLELPYSRLPPPLTPQEAADQHWTRIKLALPSEFDKRVWLEVMNEPDKDYSEWLALFSYDIALKMMSEGYRYAAFGWSSGEPEPWHWETPAMLQFLQLAGAHPDRIAIALHEYSYTVADIADGYPYLVGRFQELFRICDQHHIPRPTVLITEWGWEYNRVPNVTAAMEDIAWAAWLYSAYPQVKGAAIWYLGPGFGDIANKAQKLIVPVGEYSRSHYFVIQQGQGEINPELFQPAGREPDWSAWDPADVPR